MKTKILYVVSTLKRTGPTNILYNLINELDRNEFEPIILTLSKDDDRFPSLRNSFQEINVKIIPFSLTRIKGFLFGRQKIRNLIIRENINVLHLFGFRPDFLTDSLKLNNIKIISTINSNIYDDYTMLYGNFFGRIIAFLHIKSLKGKTAVACSGFVADEICKRYGIELKVIYNGIPKEYYKCSTENERNEFRIKLDLPLDKKIFVFVGYLIFRKDPFTVIKAFLNSKNAENSILLIIGDGPLMNECKLLCKNKENTIKFLGNLPSTLNYLKASDFYISSAYSEGLPTSVMEAMGCGLPVILSSIKPHEELVYNIENYKYLFPVNNSNILSLKIDEIADDNYEILRNKCRAVVSDNINSEIMAKNYQKIYLSN